MFGLVCSCLLVAWCSFVVWSCCFALLVVVCCLFCLVDVCLLYACCYCMLRVVQLLLLVSRSLFVIDRLSVFGFHVCSMLLFIARR